MTTVFPGAADDLGATGLTHGDVTDALAAVETYLLAGSADGRTILSGHGAPASGDGMDPLDGINDPWRWSDSWGGWASPAYEVTWQAGDTIPAYHVVDDHDPGLTPGRHLDRLISTEPPASLNAAGDVADVISTWTTIGTEVATAWTADSDGSGVAVAIYAEAALAHTAVPELAFDLTANLGDLTVGALYTFADAQTGEDGDFYVDLDAHTFYGPKAGAWPSPVSLVGPAGADGLPILTSPGGTAYRLVVADDGTLSTEVA